MGAMDYGTGGGSTPVLGALETMYKLGNWLIGYGGWHGGTVTNQPEMMARAKALGGPFNVPLTGAVPDLRIPSFSTPGFAPGGGMPVPVTPRIPQVTTPPPLVRPGPGSTPQLPGPITDKVASASTTRNQNMALDLGNLLSQAITTYGQVMTANAAHPVTPVNFSQMPVMGGTQYPAVMPQITPSGAASLGSTTHPATPGVQYVGIFDSVGNLLGFKAKKTRKRRHRKLVYKSDITGLAELKGVLGTGRLMQEFLAVRGFGS